MFRNLCNFANCSLIVFKCFCLLIVEVEKRRLYDYADYLKDEEKLVVDETKRMGKTRNANEVFGIEGTFKKLDID